jgi:hypothetical protein
MTDFTLEQVRQSNRSHHSPLFDHKVDRLFELLEGHPFLTRQALYLVSGERPKMTPAALFDAAADDSGPFGDHLRNHLLNISSEPELTAQFRNVIRGRGVESEFMFERFRGAGLAKRANGKVVPRSRLYQRYFEQRLDG